jgi:glycosidase
MAYSLMFSLPGTPVLFYGEEIGMGENLDVEGRLAVRTPMQWSDQANGGFSPRPAVAAPRPVVEGAFGPEHVNVAEQRTDPSSLLEFIALLIRRYRESRSLGGPTSRSSTSRTATCSRTSRLGTTVASSRCTTSARELRRAPDPRRL